MNDIQLEKYYIPPKEKYNLISVSIFRLNISYKNTASYYNGLKTLASLLPKYFPGFYLRVHFDNSIIKMEHQSQKINEEVKNHWIPLIEYLKTLNYVQLIKYYHPFFSTNEGLYHDGLFGTFVRFIPLFNYKTNNTNIVYISDVDVNEMVLKSMSEQYKLFEQSESQFHFRTRYCYLVRNRFYEAEILLKGEDRLNLWHRVLAGTIISKIKFPQHLLNDFLDCMTNDKNENCYYIRLFLDVDFADYESSEKKELKKMTKFIYGIDEYFLNVKIFTYIVNNKIPFSYASNSDLTTPFYNLMSRDKNKKDVSHIKYILKSILGKYYDENKNIEQNYDFFDKISYRIIKKHGKINQREKEKMQTHEYIYDQAMQFAKKMSENNEYDKYSLTKEEIKCILRHDDPYFTTFKMHKY